MASVQRPVEPYLPGGLRGKYLQHERPLLQHPGASADIDWMPNFEKYAKRVQARALLTGLPSAVPEGWPRHLESSLSWTPSTVPAESEYIYELNESQKREIIDAVGHFKGLSLQTRDISTDNFPLPSLASELEAVAENVHNGFGFAIIRGFHSVGLSGSDETIAFLGISSYIAAQTGRQNRSGDKIVHILDVNNDKVPREMRESVYTNVAQPFHSDVFCDVLALQTRSIASKGGNSIIASSWTVYNELASTRPDLIHVLAANNWTFDTYGRDPPYHQRPLLFCEKGKVFLNFSRRLLTGSEKQPRTPGIPPMTEDQAEALDAVHFTALENQVVIPMQQGDMRFLNNHAILHSRDSFEDSDQWRRHLARLWLRNPAKAWALPKGLEMAHDRVYGEWDNIDEDDLNWPLDPAIEEKTLLRGHSSCGQG